MPGARVFGDILALEEAQFDADEAEADAGRAAPDDAEAPRLYVVLTQQQSDEFSEWANADRSGAARGEPVRVASIVNSYTGEIMDIEIGDTMELRRGPRRT